MLLDLPQMDNGGDKRMYLRLKFEITQRYTIECFAKMIGISDKTLRNKINGITDFTWSECLLIRKALAVDLPLEVLFEKLERAS